MRTSLLAGAAFALAAAAARPAAAQIVPGSTLTFTGVADATDIGYGGVVLDFDPRVVVGASGNTGTFASLDTRGGPEISGRISDVRVGFGPQTIASLLTVGGYRFSLDSLPSGKFGQDACYVYPSVGQTCTPYQSVQGNPYDNIGLSPFYVANAGSGDPAAPINSTAAFDLFGTVTGPGGATSSFVGTISSSFIGQPYQYVLYGLEQDGLRGVTLTGTFTAGAAVVAPPTGGTVTPEPATLGLVFAGLLGVAGAARSRRR